MTKNLILAVLLALAPAANNSRVFAENQAAATPAAWIKTELYLGRNLADGHEVSAAQWAAFMDEVVTPACPKGLTVLDAYGQMQHESGRIEKQSTYLLLVVHPADSAMEKTFQRIVEQYRARFGPAQAMLLNMPVIPQFFAD